MIQGKEQEVVIRLPRPGAGLRLVRRMILGSSSEVVDARLTFPRPGARLFQVK